MDQVDNDAAGFLAMMNELHGCAPDGGAPWEGLDDGRLALRYCNSYNRLETLASLWTDAGIGHRAWLKLLGEEWECCDTIAQADEFLRYDSPLPDALDDAGADRRWLMNDAEWAAFQALPDEVILYRGCYAHNKRGLSWSLDRAVAERFPTLNRYRQPGQPLLVKARAPKSDVVALKLGRNEQEVIAFRPKQISTSHISPR